MNTAIKNVTPEVRSRLPQVLIDYLLKLVGANEARYISLIPCALGMGAVQDIVCETASGQEHHRVFGFPPVKADIAVRRRQDQMELAIA